MKVVHKTEFLVGQVAGVFSMPKRFHVVGFAFQPGSTSPSFWYERTDDEGWDQWQLRMVGTGEPYEDDWTYLAGPALIGDYVFHLVGKRA